MSDISCDRNVILQDYLGDILSDVCVYQGAAARISNKYTCANYDYKPVPEDEQGKISSI